MEELEKKKYHPGNKGVDMINTMSKDDLKQLRKDIIETTRTLIGQGYTYTMKVNALVTTYGVSGRQAKKYIAWTREDIKKRKLENYQNEYDEVLIKLETMYRDMYAAGKLDQALKVLNQLITLRGYEAPKQLVVKAEVQRNDFSHLTLDEMQTLQQLVNKSEVKTIEIQ